MEVSRTWLSPDRRSLVQQGSWGRNVNTGSPQCSDGGADEVPWEVRVGAESFSGDWGREASASDSGCEY